MNEEINGYTPVDATPIEDAGFTEEPTSELYRRVALPLQANLQRESLANEKHLKSFYMDWLFDKLNLSKYK